MYSFLFVIAFLFVVGAAGILISNKKVDQGTGKKRWIKFLLYLGITVLFGASIFAPRQYFVLFLILLLLTGFFEIVLLIYRKGSFYSYPTYIFLFAYLVNALSFVWFVGKGDSLLIFWMYAMIVIFDGFSQIFGHLFGRSMITKISPNKTWEGLLGGLIFTFLCILFTSDYMQIEKTQTIFIGISLMIFAFFGDLAASYIKRFYKVKDFSNLIPYHGGILDRFDSFFLAGGIYSVGVWIWSFVS